jgi:hypothetical protein
MAAVFATRLTRGIGWLVPLVLVLGAYVAMTMAWPHTIPRLSVLPRPPERAWFDGCNERFEGWQRRGLLWDEIYASTAVGCPDR